jgi:hypothetical protein
MATCPQAHHLRLVTIALPDFGCDRRSMTIDAPPLASTAESEAAEVDELVAALRPRLADTVGHTEVDRLVREARADLGQVRVTTYLPILIERRVRQQARAAQVIDVREVPVTV